MENLSAIHLTRSGLRATGADASPNIEREARDAGLTIQETLWVKPWLSAQCQVVFQPVEQYLQA